MPKKANKLQFMGLTSLLTPFSKALLHKSNFILLPLWEKVPEGRMRGVFQPKTPLTLALSHKGRGDYVI
jgi:hypothetical protein